MLLRHDGVVVTLDCASTPPVAVTVYLFPTPQAWISEVANTFSGVNGFTALAYSILTVGFFGAGISYLVAPVPMLTAVFGGSVGGAGPESIVLWQLIGIGLSTIVAPACLSLKVGRMWSLQLSKRIPAPMFVSF
jgi:hypothetical protein